MNNKVILFINKFKQHEHDNVLIDTFTLGYCYYFAVILKERFTGTILYDWLEGHFITEINNRLYDITGDVTDKYTHLYTFDEYMSIESIVHGCILKDDE